MCAGIPLLCPISGAAASPGRREFAPLRCVEDTGHRALVYGHEPLDVVALEAAEEQLAYGGVVGDLRLTQPRTPAGVRETRKLRWSSGSCSRSTRPSSRSRATARVIPLGLVSTWSARSLMRIRRP